MTILKKCAQKNFHKKKYLKKKKFQKVLKNVEFLCFFVHFSKKGQNMSKMGQKMSKMGQKTSKLGKK